MQEKQAMEAHWKYFPNPFIAEIITTVPLLCSKEGVVSLDKSGESKSEVLLDTKQVALFKKLFALNLDKKQQIDRMKIIPNGITMIFHHRLDVQPNLWDEFRKMIEETISQDIHGITFQ